MGANPYEVLKIQFSPSIIDRKDWVKYLVLVKWHAERLGKTLQRKPDAAFRKFVEAQVQAHLAGKKVPASIETAVMNLADDYLSGRESTLRTGDYIALQNEFRAGR